MLAGLSEQTFFEVMFGVVYYMILSFPYLRSSYNK